MEQRKTTWFIYGPWWLVAGCLVGQALYNHSVSRPRAPQTQLTQEQRRTAVKREIKSLVQFLMFIGISGIIILLVPLTYCLITDLLLPAFGTAAKGIGVFGGNVIQCIGDLLDAFIRFFDNL